MIEATTTDFWSLYGAQNATLVLPSHASRDNFGRAIIRSTNPRTQMRGGPWLNKAQEIHGNFDVALGKVLKKHGNVCAFFYDFSLMTFPIRDTWYHSALIELIQRSVKKLDDVMVMFPYLTFYFPEISDKELRRGPSICSLSSGARKELKALTWTVVRELLVPLGDKLVIVKEEAHAVEDKH